MGSAAGTRLTAGAIAGLTAEVHSPRDGEGDWYIPQSGSAARFCRSVRQQPPIRKGTSKGKGWGAFDRPVLDPDRPLDGEGTRFQFRPRRWSRQTSSARPASASRTSQYTARPIRTEIHGISTTRIGPDGRS